MYIENCLKKIVEIVENVFSTVLINGARLLSLQVDSIPNVQVPSFECTEKRNNVLESIMKKDKFFIFMQLK